MTEKKVPEKGPAGTARAVPVRCPGCGLEGLANARQAAGQAPLRCGCGQEWTLPGAGGEAGE